MERILPQGVTREDIAHLIRDKYNGDENADITQDLERLATDEPLGYVIGWIPFLDLHIQLDSHPLIPRPETEWWTKELIEHLQKKFDDSSFTLLDLCAGSGAIGLSILKAFPNAQVTFGELIPKHLETIRLNLQKNGLDASRATMFESDLFEALPHDQFDIIATNPPYIPESRKLPKNVIDFEPSEALYAGEDGLSLIQKIAIQAPHHLRKDSEIWIECDIDNIEDAQKLLSIHSSKETIIRNDQYGRPRVLVGYYF